MSSWARIRADNISRVIREMSLIYFAQSFEHDPESTRHVASCINFLNDRLEAVRYNVASRGGGLCCFHTAATPRVRRKSSYFQTKPREVEPLTSGIIVGAASRQGDDYEAWFVQNLPVIALFTCDWQVLKRVSGIWPLSSAIVNIDSADTQDLSKVQDVCQKCMTLNSPLLEDPI